MGRSMDIALKGSSLTNTPQTSSISPKKEGRESDTNAVTWIARCVVLIVITTCVMYQQRLQLYVNKIHGYLLSTWVYNSVYFETWWATFTYAWIIPVFPFSLHYMSSLNKYKLHPTAGYVHQTVSGMIKEAVYYMGPLMLLDTFMVKKYHGVDPSIWEQKRKSWIQTTRALPLEPPTVGQIVFHIVGSLILFDLFYFVVHLLLHRNIWLYRNIHAHHHKHDVIHPHLANQLTVVERVTLILSANLALKIFNSHPLTRAVFVPVFIWIIVDNHTGYDLPFGLHRLVPLGIVGGSAKHYIHHAQGSGNYQQIFTYLDYFLKMSKPK